MKVALVLCPAWDSKYPTYSLALLSAQLKRFDHEVGIFDLNQEMRHVNKSLFEVQDGGNGVGHPWVDIDNVKNKIIPAYRNYLDRMTDALLSRGFRAIGFSLYQSNTALTLQIASMLKKKDPGVVIIFGGPLCLRFQYCLDLLHHGEADAVIFGEADLSFPQLINDLQHSQKLKPGPGILLRQEPCTWKEAQNPILNLDELAYADYSGHNMAFYQAKTLHSCRGCVRRCVYCSDWREMRYRHMSGSRVFGEVLHQLKIHPQSTEFIFGDSLINGSIKNLSNFCDEILRHKIKISWGGFAIVRPEMTPELLAKMRQAGCASLWYGIETGSDKISKDMGKGVGSRLNSQILKNSFNAGIETHVFWIVGFPTETKDDFNDTLEFIGANSPSITCLYPHLFYAYEMQDARAQEKYSLTPTANPLIWSTKDGQNNYKTRVHRLNTLISRATAHGVKVVCEVDGFDPNILDTRNWNFGNQLGN